MGHMATCSETYRSSVTEPKIKRLRPRTKLPSVSSKESFGSLSSLSSGVDCSDDEISTKYDGSLDYFYKNAIGNNSTKQSFYRPASVNDLFRSQSLKNTTRPTVLSQGINSTHIKGHSHSISDVTFQRSFSELNLTDEEKRKKNPSFDLEKLDDAISIASNKSQSSIFRSIGSWFRSSTRSSFSFKLPQTSVNQNLSQEVNSSLTNYTPKKTNGTVQVGTSFASAVDEVKPPPPPRRKKKVLKPWHDSSSNESSDSSLSIEQTYNEDADNRSTAVKTPRCNVQFELRSESILQCRHLNRYFRKYEGVKVLNKDVISEVGEPPNADALVVPGNSFGFLDGEPEIQYVNKFGWHVQDQLRKKIIEDYDGELLVGQSVILKITKSMEEKAGEFKENETLEGVDQKTTLNKMKLNKSDQTNPEELPKVSTNGTSNDQLPIDQVGDVNADCSSALKRLKYLIYVPVMRVPSLVQDTPNAYLAFRSAIFAVKKFNKQHDDDSLKITSVICPALCDGIGSMPPGRIAFQMKTAYDEFVLGLNEIRIETDELGQLATKHVKICSMKDGNWC